MNLFSLCRVWMTRRINNNNKKEDKWTACGGGGWNRGRGGAELENQGRRLRLAGKVRSVVFTWGQAGPTSCGGQSHTWIVRERWS